jgi:predicted transcriptional regulator
MKNRDKLRIIIDILRAVKEGKEKITHITFKCNLTPSSTKKYLKWLVEKELITEMENRGNKTYKISEKGERILEHFEKVEEEISLEELP